MTLQIALNVLANFGGKHMSSYYTVAAKLVKIGVSIVWREGPLLNVHF